MNIELLEKIKKLTISALLADDLLMGVLVLKGGNALGLAYDITNRGSLDIDFSMAKDFTDSEKNRIKNQATYLLNDEFNKEGLRAIEQRIQRVQFSSGRERDYEISLERIGRRIGSDVAHLIALEHADAAVVGGRDLRSGEEEPPIRMHGDRGAIRGERAALTRSRSA